MLEQLASSLSANNLQRDLGRKAAVSANIAIALLFALEVALGETTAAQGDLKTSAVEKGLEELLRVSRESFCLSSNGLTLTRG